MSWPGTYYIAQPALGLMAILLPQTLKYWDYKLEPYNLLF